ncbi:hypothetical protein PR202_ga30447 [Eleusine coracana subsp. coracana]|uniref:Uncharacterized protein n=1 Tax=Eleusine coracana subsp. coracana TaxID=191504 RepID=A0AAV5DQM4_ELECO|nr:hypothetical protein PR202_ga30447 [Eleusine coracana subsp. coracana]
MSSALECNVGYASEHTCASILRDAFAAVATHGAIVSYLVACASDTAARTLEMKVRFYTHTDKIKEDTHGTLIAIEQPRHLPRPLHHVPPGPRRMKDPEGD